MKSVAAERQATELVVGLELRQANGAVGGGRIAAASDGGEGEERKRVDDRALRVLRQDSSVGVSVRLRLRLGSSGGESSSRGSGSGGVAEVAEAAAVEVAEEEAERDGGDDRDEEDENDDENARVHR